MHADRFPPLPADRANRWKRWGRWDTTYFSTFVGLEVEELRTDYARLRLPYRPELNQPAGVVHGGAIATLIDTVVIPAVGTGYDDPPHMLTVTMNVRMACDSQTQMARPAATGPSPPRFDSSGKSTGWIDPEKVRGSAFPEQR